MDIRFMLQKMGLLILGLSLALSLWTSSDARSEVYRWVDSMGQVHYSDKKPKVAAEDITADVSKQNIDESTEEQRKLQQILRAENAADREYHRQRQLQVQPTAEDVNHCTESRQLLHRFNGRVQLVDGEGKEIKFTEKERQKNVENFQRYLEENCNF